MKFLIITHVLHKQQDSQWFAYEPYVREMNLWLKYVDYVEIVAPILKEEPTTIESVYQHDSINLTKIPSIAFINFKTAFFSIFSIPIIIFKLFKACQQADHIHLRCPGNIGLLGCLVQIFFPKKMKTAKYAGNWDHQAKQPLSYKLQRWILSNTFLTKNMKVLVYGDWANQSKNIMPFFTATYRNSEREAFIKRDYSNTLRFIFAGSLVKGKRPLFTIKVVEELHKQGRNVSLDVYGDGVLKVELQDYIIANSLNQVVEFHGNQSKVIVKEAFKKAHFALLPSKSEGWPKAVAEAMFFGAIPIATKVSCVPYMLGLGERGILIEADLNLDLNIISDVLNDKETLEKMSKKAADWSQLFTLDKFENEIVKLLKHS